MNLIPAPAIEDVPEETRALVAVSNEEFDSDIETWEKDNPGARSYKDCVLLLPALLWGDDWFDGNEVLSAILASGHRKG